MLIVHRYTKLVKNLVKCIDVTRTKLENTSLSAHSISQGMWDGNCLLYTSMVEFFHGVLVPIPMQYENRIGSAGIDLEILEKAFIDGVKLFIFSNPNNPVGCIYSYEEICGIASLAKKYDVTLICLLYTSRCV